MARVVITSDLHLGITTAAEIEALAQRIAAERPDLTVLAGDIGEGLPAFRACLDLFTALPGKVAVLAGNHDLWSRAGELSEDLWRQALPDAAQAAGMLWLEDSVWRSNGLAVTGSIAWYDYTAADPTIPPMPEEFWADLKRRFHPDARHINWSRTDLDFAAACGDALVARVAALEADPAITDLLLVTHVPVVEEQMERRPDDPRWGRGNAYFGNLTLGRRLDSATKLRAIVSGHTHVGRIETARLNHREILAWVVPSDYHAPRYVVYDHPTATLRPGNGASA